MPSCDREKLIKCLECVKPGLDKEDGVLQSSCFVFHDNLIRTYNDETACSIPSPLSEITGAVQAAPLLKILGKMTDETVEVTTTDSEMIVKGKGEKVKVRMEAEVHLPWQTVEQPTNWLPIHECFADAVQLVQACAGKDENKPATVCIRIHPKWIEAIDNQQAMRYRFPTGIAEAFCVRKSAIKGMPNLAMTEIADTESWIHFRNGEGLTFSCRKFIIESYPPLKQFMDVQGEPLIIPKWLGQANEKAVVAAEESGHDHVKITIAPNEIKIEGIGVATQYESVRDSTYTGKKISFLIPSKILKAICKEHNQCEVSENRLKISDEKWTYVCCLYALDEKTEPSEEEVEEISERLGAV